MLYQGALSSIAACFLGEGIRNPGMGRVAPPDGQDDSEPQSSRLEPLKPLFPCRRSVTVETLMANMNRLWGLQIPHLLPSS